MQNLNKIYDKYLNKVGKKIKLDAQHRCPIRTGTLRDSINYEVNDKELTISANTNYAIFVELGTRKQQAQPFLKPAARDKNNYKG
jgi:HK97 gp10 family phage protein